MKKYLIGLMLLALISVPVVSRADTLEQLLVQLAELQAKIAELQKSRPASSCQFIHDLSLGDGEDDGLTKEVSALQKVLISGGYLSVKKPTGYFGKMTMNAVKRWQNSTTWNPPSRLAITGEIRAEDRSALCQNANFSCPQLTPPAYGWCKNGTVSFGETDERGCSKPPRCINNSSTLKINSVSGPNSLNVGQTGTWTVNATAPAGTNLTYRVAWGEMDGYAGVSAKSLSSELVKQTGTFTHSYRQAGTYTVRFNVECDGNTAPNPACRTMNTAQTSLTVVVGNNSQAPIINSATYQMGKDAAVITGERLQDARVYFNGSLISKENHTFWTDNQISFIPPTYQPGTYPVYVQNSNYRSNTAYLTILGDSSASINVIFPGEADGTSVVKGRTYQVTWTGGDAGVSTYSVYLVGSELGPAGGSRYLGLVNVTTQNSFTWTVPTDVPSGMGYQIQFSGAGATGDNSSTFIIANGQG